MPEQCAGSSGRNLPHELWNISVHKINSLKIKDFFVLYNLKNIVNSS